MKIFSVKILVLAAFTFIANLAQATIEVRPMNQVLSPEALASDFQPQQRLSYYFGVVDINSYNSARWVVTNRGTTAINYTGSYVSGIDFRASHNCYSGLIPNQQCDFTINYWPAFEGYDSGWFEITFSENNVITVDVWGEARRRW